MRARSYLVKQSGVEPSRVVMMDGGHRENLTVELWAPPAGSVPPAVTPTVDPHEVRFVRAATKRRPKRR